MVTEIKITVPMEKKLYIQIVFCKECGKSKMEKFNPNEKWCCGPKYIVYSGELYGRIEVIDNDSSGIDEQRNKTDQGI